MTSQSLPGSATGTFLKTSGVERASDYSGDHRATRQILRGNSNALPRNRTLVISDEQVTSDDIFFAAAGTNSACVPGV
jgi:hypothetical protein